jgi:hypothetical protein
MREPQRTSVADLARYRIEFARRVGDAAVIGILEKT